MAKQYKQRVRHISAPKATSEATFEQDLNNQKASTASTKVLTLVELLEPILAELSFYDLLLSQRVCRKWKSVIEGSTRLQQALYLRPRGEPVQIYHRWWFERFSITNGRTTNIDHSATTVTVVQNPVLSDIFSDEVMNGWNPFRPSQRAACKYYKASWRRMLVSQPPITKLWYRQSQMYKDGFNRIEHVLTLPPKGYESFRDVQRSNATGLRLAELVPAYNFDNRKKGGTNSMVTLTFDMKFDDRWQEG